MVGSLLVNTKGEHSMRWMLTAGTLVLVVVAFSGCRAGIRIRPPHPHVTIKTGHKHSHNCGHYHHKGKWYHHKGHVHKHNCGHKKKGGVWVWVK